MKFLEFAIATVLVCSPLLAEANLIGTTVTGCFDAIPDADVGTRTSCIGNFPQSPATVMNNDPEFLADTQSGLVFADFDSAGPDSTYLDIGLWEPTQGINPTVWEFTGIDWGGTGVIDSFVLLNDDTFPILRMMINPDLTSVFIEAARIDLAPGTVVGPMGLRARFLITRRDAPAIPEPTAALLFGTGFGVVGIATRRRHLK